MDETFTQRQTWRNAEQETKGTQGAGQEDRDSAQQQTEADTAATASEQAKKEPSEDATVPDGYGIPTMEDIASGNYFADPFGSTEQGARERYEEGVREEDLTGQEGGGQQGTQQGAGTSSYIGGGQRSTEEILKGFQDETQVPGETRTEEEWMQSPLEQETDTDYTFGAADLLDDHDAMPTIDEIAESISRGIIPGQGVGPTNELMREVNKELADLARGGQPAG